MFLNILGKQINPNFKSDHLFNHDSILKMLHSDVGRRYLQIDDDPDATRYCSYEKTLYNRVSKLPNYSDGLQHCWCTLYNVNMYTISFEL